MKLLSLLILALLFAACNPATETATGPQLSAEWTALFNGKDLTGWHKAGTFDAKVENGEIVLSHGGGGKNEWLYTDQDYSDFSLKMDFLLPDQNSGVAFRHDESSGGHPALYSYEVNLNHKALNQITGTVVNVARAEWLDSLDINAWNTLEIRAAGDHIQVFINDQKVSEAHNRRSRTGRIGLEVAGQQEPFEARFRNIQIKALEPTQTSGPLIEDYMRHTWKSQMKPIFDGTSTNGWTQTGDGYWTVEDGILHGFSGEKGGFLVSKDSWHNFYMKLTFKIANEDNSGIFIRKTPEREDVSIEDAIECNIYDHNGLSHAWSTGSIATHARAWKPIIDYDDWNEMEIFAFGDHICLYVNGRKSSEAHLAEKFNKSGNICLQAGVRLFSDNGPSHIYFKEVMLKSFDEIPFIGY